jgi:hypothetical protein
MAKTRTPAPAPGISAAENVAVATSVPPNGVTITLPLDEAPPASVSHHVRIDGNLRGAHGATLIRLRNALNNQHARLRDGKFVQSYTEALRYLLEQIEEAA